MSYRYNGKGERVYRSGSNEAVHTMFDESGRWIGDYDGNGQAVQQAIWLGDLPVGLARNAGAKLDYVEADALGTPRVVIDPTRDVAVWRWDLTGEAFGEDSPNEDPDGDNTAFVLDLRYPGQQYDSATGFNYNYFRDYDPSSGRYVQSDPIGLAGGISTYGYVGASPFRFIDPAGLLRWTNQGTTINHNFDPANPPPPSPLYSAGRVPPNAGATVSADWTIRPKCVCAAGGFALDEFEIDFSTAMYLMPSYPSRRLAAWAPRAEGDYIADYNNWAAGRGQAVARAVENKLKTMTFSSLADCEQTADATMFNSLGRSFDILQTVAD